MIKLKSSNGITLIALIITIVVLLILAGVSINMVIGENGLINKAQSAVNTYQNSATEEQIFLNQIENYIAGGLANIDSIGGKKDTLPPKQFTPTVTATETSITITGSTEDEEETEISACSGIKEYWFSKDNGATWQTNENKLTTSYTYTGLSGTDEFSLKMKAIDNAGNERITETVSKKLLVLTTGAEITLKGNDNVDYDFYVIGNSGDKVTLLYKTTIGGNTWDGAKTDASNFAKKFDANATGRLLRNEEAGGVAASHKSIGSHYWLADECIGVGAFCVAYDGDIKGYRTSRNFGVRPVIEISKSKI